MKTLFEHDFNHKHFMIGMIHTLALPGAPLYDRSGGVKKIVKQALEDSRILVDAGFHALLYCNESDMPYHSEMKPEVVAAMTFVVSEVQSRVNLPHGVNMLLDPLASLAIAHATGGRFIRCFLSGTYVGDLGFYTPNAPGLLRLRGELDAEHIRIICNVTAGFSVNLDVRPVEEVASAAVFLGLADAVCVSGPAAGKEADMNLIDKVAARVADTPVVVGTGVSAQNIQALMRVAHGFIVGTSLKREGKTLNPIDPDRAKAFMERVRAPGG
jgi:membrane complex biogenesis BtpA family protein